jgi:peptidoglycan/xylan/chitin deacetylase (PgdA/CDA1 family)
VLAEGHELGNHTWSHDDLTYLGPEQIRTELTDAKDRVEQIAQRSVTLFRPPRGCVNGFSLRVAAELGYDVLLWSVTRGPGMDVGTPDDVVRYMVPTTRAGDIISLHDGTGYSGVHDENTSEGRLLADRRRVEITALPRVLAGYAAKGLRAVTVSELLEAAD